MDQLTRKAIREAVGRGWLHPRNSGKSVDGNLGMAIAQEVEELFDRMAANAAAGQPPGGGERGNSDPGTATTTGQSCGSCRAFQRDLKHPGEGTCNRHTPVVEGRGLGLGLWPGVTEADFCCEWLPHPVAQTPLTETPP